MSCGNINVVDGTNQFDRLPSALKTDYISLDERSQEELLEFMYKLAEALAYYNSSNIPDGTIQQFFSNPDEVKELLLLQEQDKPQEISSHKALLLTFTKLFAYAQEELNKLTQKHLDYFYKDVLKITPKSAVGDQVQILFELVKNQKITEHRIPVNTKLDGGKDINGNSLIYQTDQEIIVNRAQIGQLSTLFVDEDDDKSRIFVAPFANSLDGLGTPFETEEGLWPAFGESQLKKGIESRNMADASIGFAVSSPILIMNEGERTITFDFHFEDIDPSITLAPFLSKGLTILCSGKEEWFEPKRYTSGLSNEDGFMLSVEVTVGIEQPALTFFDKEVHQDTFRTAWPVIKFILKPEALAYDALSAFRIKSVDVKVRAEGIKTLVIQNDQGVIDPSKPFLPFGSAPTIGSSFILGSREIFQKKLNYISFDIEWQDVPDVDLSNYYSVYDPDDDITNSRFQFKVEYLHNRTWDNLLMPSVSLFNPENAGSARFIEATQADFDRLSSEIKYLRVPSTDADSPYTISDGQGYLRFNLTAPIIPFKAFGHREFPKLYTAQSIALAKYDETDPAPNPEPVLPNPPYTPTIKTITLDYSSAETILPANSEYDKLFQIAPFGHFQITKENPELLTRYSNQGELYIGMDKLDVPKTVNFLFHFEEGSSNTDIELEPEDISWQYLAENQWISLGSDEIIFNSTENYLSAGIISVVIPANATKENDIMPSGYYWLKVGAKTAAEGASMLRTVYTNAATASLITDLEDPTKFDDHLMSPLEAETIKNLVTKTSNIKKIVQPFRSWNGQPTEPEEHFYTRVSERLRHKQRAVQSWDFERLVLDKFPDIFKVKCLPHTAPSSDNANGSITIIVVSNLRNVNTVNPFEPRTGRVILNRIETFLSNYVSPFVQLHIENPQYESVLVDVKVGFREGYDPGYYSVRLNEELKQFLSPWAFEEGKDIVIGGRIYKSTILLFIESRAYIDYVVDLKLYHIYEGPRPGGISEMEVSCDFIVASQIKPAISEMIIGTDFIVGEDVEVAFATTRRSILVTHLNHRITALRPDELNCPGSSNLGIGFMSVSIDFIVDES